MKSYSVAVVSSIAVALGIRKSLERYTRNMHGSKLIMMNSISSFFACSTAGYLNAWFMRRTELEKGIDVLDDKGNVYGKSKACAKKAVNQTAISRYVLAVPIFIPPTFLYMVERARLMPKNTYMRTALELSIIAVELYFAVPLAIALYPQTGSIKREELEEEFRNIVNE